MTLRRAAFAVVSMLAVSLPSAGHAGPLAMTAGLADAPVQASAESYLDYLTGKTFRSPLMRAKVTMNEKGEWRLQAPDGSVTYIARDAAGGYRYSITSPAGIRFSAAGAVGERGVSVCGRTICSYWLTTADQSPFFVQTQTRGDGSRSLFAAQPMIEDGTPQAAAMAKVWESREGDPTYLIWRKRKTFDQVFGFAINDIDAWAAGAATPAAVGSTRLATVPVTAPAERIEPTVGSAQPGVVPAPSPVSARAPVDARRWGMLSQMAGTTWVYNGQFVEIDWLTPNAAMLIKEHGLFGESEVLITPAADGKRLRYLRNEPGLREVYEGTAAPDSGRFYLVNDTRQRLQCRLNKGALACEGTDAPLGKPRSIIAQYAAIARSDVATRIAAQPGVFPKRPTGWFHPKFGLFGDLAGGRWELTHTAQGGAWTKTPGGLALQVGAGDSDGSAVLHLASTILGKRSLLFRENAGTLIASVGAANHKSPEARANVALTHESDGSSSYCYFIYTEQTCERWHLSSDGKRVLVVGKMAAYVLSQAQRPTHLPGKLGLMGTLNELSFQSPGGQIISYTIYGVQGQAAGGATIHLYRNGEVTGICSTTGTPEMDCSAFGKNRRGDSITDKYKSLLTIADDREFTRGGLTYRMVPDGNLVATDSKGAQTIFRRINWSDLRYMEQAKEDNERIGYAYADQKSRQQSSDAFWRGIAAGIAEIPNTMRQHSAATSYMAPTDWSSRIASSPQTGVPGYQSMGTISRVEAPQMTLAQRYQQDELARFTAAEQINVARQGGSGPAAPTAPYAKAYDQLARDRAASDAITDRNRAVREATEAGQQRARLAADDADLARQRNEVNAKIAEAEARRRAIAADAAKPQTGAGGSATGGIIVKSDDTAARMQREAEARDRQTADRAAKDRAALARYAAQDAADKRARAQADAEARNRSEIACYGRVRTEAERARKGGANCR